MDLKNIKSWHIALIGWSVPIIHVLRLPPLQGAGAGLDGVYKYLFVGIGGIIGLSSIILLYSKNDVLKKIGAGICILIGLIFFWSAGGSFYGLMWTPLIFTGIYYFWKKV